MDRLEYQNELDSEKHKLRYRISKNAGVALVGISIAAVTLLCDMIRLTDITTKLMNEPSVKELYSKKTSYETKNEEELRKMIKEKYAPKVEISKNLEEGTKRLAGASVLYFILGSGISAVRYHKKKKDLEKELN
jgi:hypothetical protein